MRKEITDYTDDQIIRGSRILSAPIAMVYKAFSNPHILARWWGPFGFANTFHTFDFQLGGKWIYTMHDTVKGINYPNECEYIRIEENKKLVWDHIAPKFQIHIELEEQGESSTKLIFTMVFDNKEAATPFRLFAPEKNEENFTRLEHVLKEYI